MESAQFDILIDLLHQIIFLLQALSLFVSCCSGYIAVLLIIQAKNQKNLL